MNEEPFGERAYGAEASRGRGHTSEGPQEEGGERLKMVRRSQRRGEDMAAPVAEDRAAMGKAAAQLVLLDRLRETAERMECAADELRSERRRFLEKEQWRREAAADGRGLGGFSATRASRPTGIGGRMRWVALCGVAACALLSVLFVGIAPSSWTEPVRLTREERLMVAIGREAYGGLAEAQQKALRELHQAGQIGARRPEDESLRTDTSNGLHSAQEREEGKGK